MRPGRQPGARGPRCRAAHSRPTRGPGGGGAPGQRVLGGPGRRGPGGGPGGPLRPRRHRLSLRQPRPPGRGRGRRARPRAHPVLRLQLRQPLLPQRLQLLLRHAAGSELSEKPRPHSSPHSELPPAARRRERGPPHCAGARSTQASPIQPGAAPPDAVRAPEEAGFRDRRRWGRDGGQSGWAEPSPAVPHHLVLNRSALAGIT